MRILVIREGGGLGDAVTIQPAVAGLREKHPDAEIDWLLPRALHPLFARDPAITRLAPLPPGHRRRSFHHHRRVDMSAYRLDGDYDLIVDMWCPCWRHEHENDWDARKSRIENFCEEASVEPQKPKLYLHEEARRWAGELLGSLPRPRYLVAWHTANPSKDYPVDLWAKVAAALAERGAGLVFAGRSLFPKAPEGAVNLMNPKLAHLAALCGEVDGCICLDSGIGHIAAALDTPSLWLFGPTNPISTLKHYPNAEWLWRPEGVDCEAPCYYSQARRFRCRGRPGDCMKAIPPEAVVLAAERIVKWEGNMKTIDGGKLEGEALYHHYRKLGIDFRACGRWQRQYAEFIDRVFLIKGRRVLDIGSACGAQVKGFYDIGANVYGVEPDPWMAMHPVDGLWGRLVFWPADEPAFAPGTFDLVHSSQVLEHVDETRVEKHLAACYAALKPGGVMCAMWDTDQTPGVTRDVTHVTIKPGEWWEKMFVEAGFEDASESFRERVQKESMQRKYGWNWVVLRKTEVRA